MLAKHTWVWNKKFTVKTTTKLSASRRTNANLDNTVDNRKEKRGAVAYAGAYDYDDAISRRRRRRRRALAGRLSVSLHPPPVDDGTGSDELDGKRKISDDNSSSNWTFAKAVKPVPMETLAGMKMDLNFETPPSSTDILKRLVELGNSWDNLLPSADLTDENRVPGCAARVWITCHVTPQKSSSSAENLIEFRGESDSSITRGLCALLCKRFSGYAADDFLSIDESFIKELGLDPILAGSHHRYGLFSMFDTMKKRVYNQLGHRQDFPSLLITKDDLVPQGAYAESQATYLKPDQETVRSLVQSLQKTKAGVVAHFYMDPEVQGVLSSAQAHWPHIYISDSLVMADRAVEMAKAGCKRVCVLGVDFMAENVRATLDHQGYHGVEVYRMDEDLIGCTLAEAAESKAYERFLEEASRYENSLHVVYINTSLKTKALAQSKVPTITCTSSNVIQTILQSSSQLEGEAEIFYGPDAYMGANIEEMLTRLSLSTDEEVRKIHPKHDVKSIKKLLGKFHYFRDGICLVHDMFGSEVAKSIKENYADAFLTAHFEVPGEMFQSALHASYCGDRGVIGSTKNILDFIVGKVEEANKHGLGDKLQFILGTESGMITSVVNSVQSLLKSQDSNVKVEIVFPVSANAIVAEKQVNAPEMPFGLNIVPGAASGEGCSMEGGCASCPYMKMNSLDALLSVLERVDTNPNDPNLSSFAPRNYEETTADGKSFAAVGTVPILHMRHFQQHKKMSDEFIQDVKSRSHQIRNLD
jgi:quinolinate synthase